MCAHVVCNIYAKSRAYDISKYAYGFIACIIITYFYTTAAWSVVLRVVVFYYIFFCLADCDEECSVIARKTYMPNATAPARARGMTNTTKKHTHIRA